jgi:hypothetical protein
LIDDTLPHLYTTLAVEFENSLEKEIMAKCNPALSVKFKPLTPPWVRGFVFPK